MTRRRRVQSESGRYHVMVKATNHLSLFLDDMDNTKFIRLIERYTNETGVAAEAYCLMKTHAHLLIKDNNCQLDRFMKKISVSYVYYYNKKYGNEGSLFRDRFKSEPVDSDEYYLAVLKYIHRNPEKAGICDHDKYKWSSYGDYISGTGVTNTEFAISLLGSVESFCSFVAQPSAAENPYLEFRKADDAWAKEILEHLPGNVNLEDLLKNDPSEAARLVGALTDKGFSVRQIARISGIDRNKLRGL